MSIRSIRLLNICFKYNFWKTYILFQGLLIPLYWTSGDTFPGFQSQGGSITCMFSCLHAMDFSDLPLVQHLLTSYWPVWQPSLFSPADMSTNILGSPIHDLAWICIFLIACEDSFSHSFCNTFLIVKCLELEGQPLLIKTVSLLLWRNRSWAFNEVTMDQSVLFPFLRHLSRNYV